MKTTKILALIALLFVQTLLFAQNKVMVTGVVTDEDGQPMPGAGVVEKGTTNGSVTDLDGNYSIVVPATATLEFNFIGYGTEEAPVKGRKVLNIQLSPDRTLLDESVVIGYGTVKRSDLTGSISSVGAKAVKDFKTASVTEALGGKIAGVSITASDGTPGEGYDIKIRGIGSLNGETSPLYIVDGYEVESLDYLANQDIASIDVLKDASAAAIYGARGANGVIVVTTKSGREGRPQISYNGSVSYRSLSKKLDVLSAYEFVKLQMEAFPTKYANTYYSTNLDDDGNPYKYTSLDDYKNVAGIDWQDEAFNDTWSQSHDISIMGGTKDSQYSLSFSHFDEDGIFTNSGYTKNTGRFKLFQKVNKWANFNVSVSYTGTDKTGVGTGGGLLANLLMYRPTGGLSVTDEELLTSMYDPLGTSDGSFDSNQSNPVIQAESVEDETRQEQWIANGSITLRLMKNLTFKTSGTYNASYRRRDIFYGEGTSQAYRNGSYYGSSQTYRYLKWQNSNVLTYSQKFNKKHNVNVTLGHEISYNSTEYVYGQAEDFPIDDLGTDNLGLGATPTAVETSKTDKKLLSFFARAFYSYDDRYMITGTIRADASTVFSEDNKWGYFPSFAAAWTISNEEFMKPVDWVSMLKLRLGWGIVGNDRISSYLSLDLYDNSKYGWGSSQVTVLNPSQLANKDLKWEGSETINIGVDFSIFNSRVNLTVDGFVKNTKDLLLAQNLALVTGFSSQWQNVGKIRNKGIEITINSINIDKRAFSWSTDFNVSFIKNTLVALQDGTDYIMSLTGFNSNFTAYDYVSYVGSTIGDMYGFVYDGVYQYSDFNIAADGTMTLKEGVADITDHAGTDVVPGMVKYKDIDGDGVITSDDRTVIGNGYPDWYGGITNSFNFYNFDFSFMFQFSVGNDIYNATRLYATQTNNQRSNALAEVKDRWTSTNASNSVPAWDGYVKSEMYSRFIEDGSYLRLKNITLGYTIPSRITRKAYISRLRVYASAQNLFVLTKYSGYDPEVNTKSSPLMPGFDWGAYPKAQVFTFGIELQL